MSDDDDKLNNSESDDKAALLEQLKKLRAEHRLLDCEITALRETGAVDMLNIARMKKIKLRLKERIVALENKLTPDIIA